MDAAGEKSDTYNPQESEISRSLPGRITLWLSKPFPLTWESVTLIVLSITAVVTRLVDLGARVMSHDESLHVFYSWQLATGKGFIHTPMMHGPLLFESTALVNFLLGANDFTSRLVPALLGIFIAIVIPRLLIPWIGKLGALVCSALFLVSPYMLYYSRYIRHDMLVIAWVLLAVVAILAYIRERKEWHLVLFVAALALMFSTMEISFIYLAILASFLLIRIWKLYRFHWHAIKDSAEFDLLVLMITLGAFFSSPIALAILNPIGNALFGAPFVDLSILGTQDASWAIGFSGLRLWLLFGVFAIAGTVLGIVWSKKRWLKLAALFLAITIPLFTTFFTNPAGLASGFIGSLGYWMSQQGVARGGQPWYYFLIVFPLYEYLPLIGGFAAAIFFAFHRKYLSPLSRMFFSLALWWGIGIFIGLSLAGEKMPWLSTHLTVPFILMTAWWVGQLLQRNQDENAALSRGAKWRTGLSLGVVGVLFVLTIRTSFFANYVNYDYTTEYIDYAHGAPGVKWVLDDIQSIANHTGDGKNLKIAYDDEVSWPMSWYLRDYTNQVFFGAQPTREALNVPVVIAGPKNWTKVEQFLGSNYHRFEVIRLWWPLEDYKNLTFERIWNVVTDPAMRAAVWNILWMRDYSSYASLTNQVLSPPTDWNPAEKMRVYVRNDIALKMLSLSLGSTMLPDVPKKVDAYASVERQISPVQTIQNAGLNAPRNMAIGKDGSIYTVDTANSRVVKFDANGKQVAAWGSRTPDAQKPGWPGTFVEPWGIAVDQDGNVLVADTWNHRIQKFDPNGNFILQWGTSGLAEQGVDQLWGPRAVAVAPNGNIYVTDTGNKRVVVFSPDGKGLFAFGSQDEPKLDEPVGIAVDSAGKVYVADTWNMRVAIFSLDGKFLSSFQIQGWASDSLDNKPYLAVDGKGQVYVTDPEGYRVLVFSPDGTPLLAFGQFGPEENNFGMPNGIALGPDGKVWVADAGNNRIMQYSGILP